MDLSSTFIEGNDYYIFRYQNNRYIFFSAFLQIYSITDDFIKTYFKYLKGCDSSTSLELNKILYSKLSENNKPQFAQIDNSTKSIVLNISGVSCNLKCSYCFAYTEEDYKPNFMTFKDAKNAVDFLINSSFGNEAEYYGIVFFGGEPFLNSNIIEQTVKYCEEVIVKRRKKKFSISATTNGTILNNKIIEIFKNHKSEIIISLDGPKDIHEANRPSKDGSESFNNILRNAKILKNNNIPISFRPTISLTSGSFKRIIRFFESLKTIYSFEYVIQPKFHNFSNELANLDENELKRLYSWFVLFLYRRIVKGQEIYCQNVSTALFRLEYQYSKFFNCSSGKNTITINADGTIYSCQNISNDKNMAIGSIDENIKHEKLTQMSAPHIQEINSCSRCWIRYLCAGGCFSEKLTEMNDVYIPISQRCEIKRIQWASYLKLYQIVKDNHPVFFEKEVSGVSI